MKNLDEILAMAQNVQSELQKAQDQLDTIEVEGVSGGGLVKVKATAKGRIIGIAIDDSLIEVSEKQMLEDLLAAAFNGQFRVIENWVVTTGMAQHPWRGVGYAAAFATAVFAVIWLVSLHLLKRSPFRRGA